MKQKPKKRKAAPEQVTLEFADNGLLAALSGPHQKHFARLEQKLGVMVNQRGNLVGIAGTAETHARAATILGALYARLQAGESVTLAEVDAEIRFTDSARAAIPGAIRTASARLTRRPASRAASDSEPGVPPPLAPKLMRGPASIFEVCQSACSRRPA